MSQLISAIGVCLLLAQGCAPDSDRSMSKKEKDEVKKEVTKRVEDYVASMKKLDIEEMLTFWANTEKFVKAGDGPIVVGYDTFVSQQREKMSKVTAVNYVNVSNVHIYVLALDAASFSFEFEWSMTGESGEEMNSKGSWTYVFKKFDNEWKVIHSTGSHLKG